MACRWCSELLLKLLNFVFMVSGLAMVGYGVYLLVEWNKVSSGSGGGGGGVAGGPVSADPELLNQGRPVLLIVPMSTSFVDHLPRAWFIYVFIGIGGILFAISCFGCIGVATRNRCCLSCYSFLVVLMILVELAAALFIFFDHSWKEVIPADKTGNFDMIYNFLKENWKIAKWVALAAVILEALTFLLAIIVRAANQPEYDSDDEYIAPRPVIRQPLLNRQGNPAPGVPVLDNRPSRTVTWTQRMRGKYGLDTAELSYKPTDPSRFQQGTVSPAEGKGRCTIL